MNFVCIVFEIGDKMLTLSSMENLIVQWDAWLHKVKGRGKTQLTIWDVRLHRVKGCDQTQLNVCDARLHRAKGCDKHS